MEEELEAVHVAASQQQRLSNEIERKRVGAQQERTTLRQEVARVQGQSSQQQGLEASLAQVKERLADQERQMARMVERHRQELRQQKNEHRELRDALFANIDELAVNLIREQERTENLQNELFANLSSQEASCKQVLELEQKVSTPLSQIEDQKELLPKGKALTRRV